VNRPTDDLAVAFQRHWGRHFAPDPGRVVVAVSGGVDSMALLALLGRESATGRLDVVAAHFDHGTRGADSRADGRFVEAVAGRWGIRAILGRGDAPARAAASGRGPQAAARELRYGFLAGVAADLDANFVATGHHRDDRVETVLLRIARGTSPDGLAGPAPLERRRGMTLVRPLLPFARDAIEAWAEAEGIPFRDDPSNRDPRYPRTRVRRDLVPRLRALNPRFDEAVVRLSAQAAADAAYLAERTERALEDASAEREPGCWSFAASRLVGRPDPVLSRAVLAAWAGVAPAGAAPPGAEWVEGAMRFLRGGRGGRIPAPGGVEIVRTGPIVEFRRSGSRTEEEVG